MITQFYDLLKRIDSNGVTYEVEDSTGTKLQRTAPEPGDKVLRKVDREELVNQLVIALFGQKSQIGREPQREPKEGKYWLTKAEYEYLLSLFVELRRRTPSPYLSDVEKDHPLFKRVRVRGILSSSTTGGV